MSAPKRARKNPPKASKAAASANDVPLEPAAPSVKISTLTLPLCRSILTELSALNSENASIIADRVAAHTATEAAKAFDYKPIFTKLNKELRQGYKRAKNRYYYVDEVHEAAGQAWNEIKKACPESSGYESHISCFEALCGIAEIVNKEDVADGLQNGEFQNYLSEDMFKILDRVQVKKEDMTRLMKRVKEIDQSAERSDYEELLQKMKAKTAKDKKTAAKD